MSGFKQAAGGMHDPAPYSFRVEITVLCSRGHALLPFHRSTLPERENEGVMYDRGRVGRSVTLAGEGQDWERMRLGCLCCGAEVLVNRARLESRLAGMWAPYARECIRDVWSGQSR